MFDCQGFRHARSSLFSTISLAAILFVIIFAYSFISNVSLHSIAFKGDEGFNTGRKFKSTYTGATLLAVKEEVAGEGCRESVENDLINPPFNLTEQERIAWFRRKLPEIGIFRSTELAQRFDVRLHEFLDRRCRVRFFMTWISPAEYFGGREFITVESLFKANPHGCLTILSRTMDSGRGYTILKPLLDRGFRLLAVSPDLPFLLKDTPAEDWFEEMKSGNRDPGEIPLAQNLSNLLRLAALYKYGGVYLDTDFVVLKEFSGLRNSIGAQSVDVSGNWTRLNNAVLVFDKYHPLLYKFIEEFALTFDGNKWGHNGPYLVSRVVGRVANRSGYNNFTVLPPMAFYPVDWTRVFGYFRRPANSAESKWVEAKLLQLSRETYGLHLWNRQSRNLRIEEGSVVGRLISNHCVILNGV